MIDDRFRFGDVILRKDSFLRKAPIIIKNEQLVVIEAIVFSADTIEHSFNAACVAAISLSGDTDVFDERRTELFTRIWTIVDHLHAIRYLFRKLADDSVDMSKVRFMQLSEVAWKLRDKMDHFGTNINNIAEKKRNWPLFGAVTYFVPKSFYDKNDTEGLSFLATGTYSFISTGVHATDVMAHLKKPNSYRLSTKIDLLELQAFGLTLEFAPVLAELVRMLEQLEEMERDVFAGIEERASDADEREALLKSKQGDLAIHFSMAFDPPGPS